METNTTTSNDSDIEENNTEYYNNEILIDEKQQEEFYQPSLTTEEPSQQIKELLYKFNSLTGGESDFDNFDVKLYRLAKVRGQKPKKEFIEDYNYIPSLSEIRNDYGPGDYILYLTFMLNEEEKIKTKEFSISDIIKKSEQEKIEKEKLEQQQNQKEEILLQKIEELEKRLINSNEQQTKSENQELVKLVLQQNENSKNEMREMFMLMNQNQNNIMQKFLEHKNNLPAVQPQNDMKTFLQGLEIGRDFGFAEGEGDNNNNHPMWNAVGEIIAGFLGGMKTNAEDNAEKPQSLQNYENKMYEAEDD